MNLFKTHTFHIPVLGLGYTLDTPIKVAPFGISSVISLVDDTLMEKVREFYSKELNLPFQAIPEKVEDCRAKRITSYLNMVNSVVSQKVEEIKKAAFEKGSEIEKYIDMLPSFSEVKEKFNLAHKSAEVKNELLNWIHNHLPIGDIDVNIMTKLDKTNYKDGEELPIEYNDAHAALRGFANSDLSSGIVLSAGMSPRLFTYMENFEDFFPDSNGEIKKKVILKVSDYRSALVQGKMLAAKGIWVSEYRIESGVNCGGHAFPTNGVLFGPILEEFKNNRDQLLEICLSTYNDGIAKKNLTPPTQELQIKITAQGGVGTTEEHDFLLNNYNMDSIGWGTPFMLVPEAISIDTETLNLLADAKEDELYFSGLSPLGVPFNSVKWASMSVLRQERVKAGNYGSPCTKQYLKYNTEYTDKPICTASKQYQSQKLEEIKNAGLSEEDYQEAYDDIIEKECLCVGLGISLLESKGIPVQPTDKVTVCPGPNLAYFSKVMSLKEIVDHIYGRVNMLDDRHRPHMFLKEMGMYLDIFKKRFAKFQKTADDKKELKQLKAFQKNLFDGVAYYKELFHEKKKEVIEEMEQMLADHPITTAEL